jgi:hypothetical protein
MIHPAAMAIAALTLMLWILWSDSLRSRKPTPILYAIRVVAYLTMATLLVLSRFRYPWLFSATSTALVYVAALIGLGGAIYFGRRIFRRA